LEALAGRLEEAFFGLDFWQLLLVFFVLCVALMLRAAHMSGGNYLITDLLCENTIASLKKHLCAGAWVFHTWVILHQEASRSLSDNGMFFYAVLWAGVYLLGPVFPAVAQAIVSKWAGVTIPPGGLSNGTDSRAAG
jgi:hypothetical protein